MSNSELVKRWFEEIWNRGNVSAIDELLSEQCSVVGLDSTDVCCRNEMRMFYDKMTSALENIKIEIDQIVESPSDEIAVIFSVTAVHRATQKPVSCRSAAFGTVENGQFKSVLNVVDFLTLFIHAGVLPENAVEKGLMSTRAY